MKSKEIDEIKEYLKASIDHIYKIQGIPKNSRDAFTSVVSNLLDEYKERKILQ